MSGKLSPRAQIRMAALRTMEDKVQHVYGMVEKFAAKKDERQAQMLVLPMKRAFGKLKLDLMGAGFDTMSQLAGSMEVAAGRGGSRRMKVRILREGVGSLKFQIEHEQRRIVSEDEAAQAREAAQEREAASEEPDAPSPDS